jgi:hypothetical protein
VSLREFLAEATSVLEAQLALSYSCGHRKPQTRASSASGYTGRGPSSDDNEERGGLYRPVVRRSALLRLKRGRRPTVSDRARALRILEEVITVDRPRLSGLRPSAGRHALIYLPVNGIHASVELWRVGRVSWRRCWPVGESACREQQCGDDRKRGHQTTLTHVSSPQPQTGHDGLLTGGSLGT